MNNNTKLPEPWRERMKRCLPDEHNVTTDDVHDFMQEEIDFLRSYIIQVEAENNFRLLHNKLAHTDHPLRHFDRTCPACNNEASLIRNNDVWLTDGERETLSIFKKPEDVCNSVKVGEYDLLRCCRSKGHEGEHNYVVSDLPLTK